MSKSQQKLKKIEIDKLKGLTHLEVDFTESPLVAILGPNGIGKSTILHAIACINKPVTQPYRTINHKLSEFFTPTTHSTWTGSSFSVYQDYREGKSEITNHKTQFRKEVGRWAPRYDNRIERYVSYIGIKTCVPIIENETQQSRIQFNTIPLTDNISNQVRELAGSIMNKTYEAYNRHPGRTKEYIGVSTNGIDYSSLSMGAGEQRIFYILSEALKADKYGLLIIDEIDLLLHQDALFRLMKSLNEIASDKHLQIIFTTHAQSLLNLEFIAFRHLFQTPEKTLCFNQTKPDALQRLTGTQIRPLEIFVEDDLAATMIKKICSKEGMSKYVSIKTYGAATNCFTAVCGSILNNLDNQENMLFVLDGDVFRTEDEKKKNIKKVLTGSADADNINRDSALSRITQFNLPEKQQPERYYHSLICDLSDNSLTSEYLEIVNAARQIVNPRDNHKFFNDVINRMDFTREVGLNKLVDILSLTPEWNKIKENIKVWLDNKRNLVMEN